MYKVVLDKNNKQLGCDISKYQGKVDFFKMKKAGVKFVIIRAGYGTTEDPYFKAYVDGASKAGLLIGVYWFMYGGSVAKAMDNAKKCLEVIEPHRNKMALGIWADWEYHSDEQSGVILTNTTRSMIVRTFLNMISEQGYFTGIYSNQDYIKSKKFLPDLIKDYPLWYALYSDSLNAYGNLGKGGHPIMWQYTSKGNGRLYGVSSVNIDLDFGYFKLIDDSQNKGITVEQFKPSKGNPEDWVKIICNLKKALNTTFGLSFAINGVIDDILIRNLANVTIGYDCPLTDINYVLQQIFVWWGYDLAIDGILGKNTADTIGLFQSQVGITKTKTTTLEFWKKILGK